MNHHIWIDREYRPINHLLIKEFVNQTQQNKQIYYLLPNISLIRAAQDLILNEYRDIILGSEICTLDYLVKKILDKSDKTYKQISADTKTIITIKLLRDLAQERKLTWLNKFERIEDLAPQLVRVFGQIKRNDLLTSDSLKSTSFTERERDIITVFNAYQSELRQNNLVDTEQAFIEAIEICQNNQTIFFGDTLIISGFSLNKLQLKLLNCLRTKFKKIIVYLQYDSERTEIFRAEKQAIEFLQGKGFEIITDKIERVDDTVGNLIFSDCDCKIGLNPIITMQGYQSKRQEVSEVLRAIKSLILEHNYEIDDIAIITSSVHDYADLLKSHALKASIPLHIGGFQQLIHTMPVRRILQLLKVSTRSWSADVFLELLTDNYIWPNEVHAPLIADFIRITPENGPLEKWLDACSKQIEYYQYLAKFSTNDDTSKERLNELINIKQGLQYLKHVWDTHLPDQSSPNELTEGLLCLMRVFGVEDMVLQHINSLRPEMAQHLYRVWSKIVDVFQNHKQLENLWPESLTVSDFYYMISEIFKSLTVDEEFMPVDSIKVLNPVQISGQEFRTIFILGANEGKWPSNYSIPWLSNGGDDEQTGLSLPSMLDQLAKDKLNFSRALAVAIEKICISYVMQDQDGTELLPFPFIDEIVAIDADFQFSKRNTPLWPAKISLALCQSEALEIAVSKGLNTNLTEDIKRRINIEEMRGQNKKNIYNGNLQDQRIIKNLQLKFGKEAVFSTTMLEQYAKCPWSFYLDRLLKIKSIEPLPFGVTPLSRGSIMHRVLAKFMEKYVGQQLISEKTALYEQQLLVLLQGEVRQLQASLTSSSAAWVAVESERLFYLLRLWLKNEIELHEKVSLRPELLEYAFCNDKALSIKLEIDQKQQDMIVEGFIDRVDINSEAIVVYDYKTGLMPKLVDVKDGVAFQIPFYLMVAAELFPEKKVLGGGYYQLAGGFNRNSGVWKSETLKEVGLSSRIGDQVDDTTWQELQSSVVKKAFEYRQSMQNGNYHLGPRRPCPSYCPYRDVCRMTDKLFARVQQEGSQNEIH